MANNFEHASFAGKIAVVTGAAQGIGEAVARLFAARGVAGLLLTDRTRDRGEAVAKSIGDAGTPVEFVAADLGVPAEVETIIPAADKRFGRVDVLVNNAGVEKESPFLEKPESEWDLVTSVNLKGPFLCSQAAARDMAKRKKGTIINISSVHEDLPFPGYSAYCASKGGLRMLCRDLALELAPHGINVINVAPGAIDTPINKRTLSDPEKKLALKREIPLGRVGEPREVAKLVCYLASDDASYITGTTVVIDGGLMHQTQSL